MLEMFLITIALKKVNSTLHKIAKVLLPSKFEITLHYGYR